MADPRLSKRAMMVVVVALLSSCTSTRMLAQITAAEAIAKIEAATGATPPKDTVDTIKAGDPATPITGVVVTFMDTYAVLQKAVALHANLIVTHEPTFYNHPDDRTQLPGDPVTEQKLKYIQDHGLVVWRFHDTWHARQPDGVTEALVKDLGWQKYQSPALQYAFHLPEPTTVQELANRLQAVTGSHWVQIVGDPRMKVQGVGLEPGAAGLQKQTRLLSQDGIDVLIAGESAQWEGVAWTLDAAAEGRHKALILLGHEASEEPGMKWCAEWLKGVLPGVPVTWVSAGEPWANGTH